VRDLSRGSYNSLRLQGFAGRNKITLGNREKARAKKPTVAGERV
jgi:hypothetical protein